MIIPFSLRPDPDLVENTEIWIAVAETLINEGIFQIRALPAHKVPEAFSFMVRVWAEHTAKFRALLEKNQAWRAIDIIEAFRASFESKSPKALITQHSAFQTEVLEVLEHMSRDIRAIGESVRLALPRIRR